MPLKYEMLPSSHEDHKPVQEGDTLVLCAAEGPTFIKKGTSKLIRTGVKLIIPAQRLCAIAYRRKHGDGHILSDLSIYTPSSRMNDGKAVEGSVGEGLTGEVSVLVAAPPHIDLNIRFGEPFAVAFIWTPADVQGVVAPQQKEAPKVEAPKEETKGKKKEKETEGTPTGIPT